jgi:hypothetical protein
LADLDGDGHLDMFSGSYWPGDIFMFRGAAGGKYEKGEILMGADGKHVNAGPPWQDEKKPENDSLAASPWLVDFDGDGDLDLLIGNLAGRVILIANEGDARKPVFVRKGALQAAGTDIDVGHGDAGPTTADWDGDGRWDLLVGAGDGSVMFYRNAGTANAPAFAPGVALIPPAKGGYQIAHDQTPQRSCMRAKVHCADWNGDGHLDLLVGDYISVKMPEPELTEEQLARRDELRKEQQKLGSKLSGLWQKESDETLTEAEKAELQELQEQNRKVYEELRPLQAANKAAGWVWVYLRRVAERND